MPDTRMTAAANNVVQAIHANQHIKYPTLNTDNPDLFFDILDSLIKLYKIPKDQAFLNVFVNLPYNVQAISKHLLTAENENPIDEFRKLVNEKFKLPIEDRLKKLINSKKANDIKPSAYLLHIRDTLGKEADQHKNLIRSHFIDSLPKSMATVIRLLSPDCSLDELAKHADKNYTAEADKAEIANVDLDEKMQLVSQINVASTMNDLDAKISDKLSKLQKQIEELHEQIKAIKSNNDRSVNPRNNRRSVSRDSRPIRQQTYQNQSRRSQSSHNIAPKICYWHQTFKNRSFKCEKPCDFARVNSFPQQRPTGSGNW